MNKETQQKPAAEDIPATLLPEALHLLCVAVREPDWPQTALALSGAGCVEPRFRWASSAEIALSELRETPFDCLLIELMRPKDETLPAQQEGLALLQAMRAIGHDDPVVVICESMDDTVMSCILSLECEFLVSSSTWESPVLSQMIHRAITKTELGKELQQLSIERRRRLQSERKQAEHLLKQQRAIIQELAASGFESTERRKPAAVESSYHFLSTAYCDLLRTYVVMDPGSLSLEIRRLAEEMSQLGFSPQDALKLHHEQTQRLADDSGEKSALHIITRTGALGMELLAHLGEYYRRKTSGS